ncbi:MAG TPA: MerR family transcriptional regulator [Chitinivibrionales bacterium]|jgi:DNA-binding transcriptional MerR regulator|nr:MerR family transcriptional regulator [Chitinivibrionales bacterium]
MLDKGKTYYSISEVCAATALEPHVLRYWESEFAQLRPKKNRAGNRAYRDKDIEIVRYIKYLLYEEQYTIPGAKKKLAETKEFDMPGQMQLTLTTHAAGANNATSPNGRLIEEVAQELKNVLQILRR